LSKNIEFFFRFWLRVLDKKIINNQKQLERVQTIFERVIIYLLLELKNCLERTSKIDPPPLKLIKL